MNIENFRAVSLLMRMTAFAQVNHISDLNIKNEYYSADSQIFF